MLILLLICALEHLNAADKGDMSGLKKVQHLPHPEQEHQATLPTNISGQKLIWMASFMLPLGLGYVEWSMNVMLMVAELNR